MIEYCDISHVLRRLIWRVLQAGWETLFDYNYVSWLDSLRPSFEGDVSGLFEVVE